MDYVCLVKIQCLYGKEWDNTSWFPTRKLMFGPFVYSVCMMYITESTFTQCKWYSCLYIIMHSLYSAFNMSIIFYAYTCILCTVLFTDFENISTSAALRCANNQILF